MSTEGSKGQPKDGRTEWEGDNRLFRMRWVMEPVTGEEQHQSPALKIFCSCVLTSRCAKKCEPFPRYLHTGTMSNNLKGLGNA